MTIHDLDKLLDVINDYDMCVVQKIIVTEELYDELTGYSDINGGKFSSRKNSLYYRDFEIIKDK